MGGKGSGRQRVNGCGTKAGYTWHRRHGEEACEACKAANRAYYQKKRGYNNRGPRQPKKTREQLLARGAKYSKDRRRAQKAIIDAWKLAQGACADCGWEITPDRLCAIDCDHIDPKTKKYNLSERAGSIPPDALEQELAKCQARCRNCHAIRTRDEGHWYHRNGDEGPEANDAMAQGQIAGAGWQPTLPLV